MLAAAQNKLLKVLEEPPENVVFLLGSASEYAVLSTVRSRTKRLDLHSFPERDIEAYLKEKYPFPPRREGACGALGRAARACGRACGGRRARRRVRQACAAHAHALSPAAIPAEAAAGAGQGGGGAHALASAARLPRPAHAAAGQGRSAALRARTGRRSRAWRGAIRRRRLCVRLGRIGQCERELRANSVVPQSIEALLHGILEDQ